MVKFLRHNHPMKFGNLIDMLSHISPIELDDSDFLLKVNLKLLNLLQKITISDLFCKISTDGIILRLHLCRISGRLYGFCLRKLSYCIFYYPLVNTYMFILWV